MSCPVTSSAAAPAVPAEADDRSLWLRMGGEAVIKPMVSAIYDLHASDPLSAELFGPMKYANSGDPSVVKEHVFTFFSSGIGGPHEYKGRSMIDAHKGMHISESSFQAVVYHVIKVRHKCSRVVRAAAKLTCSSLSLPLVLSQCMHMFQAGGEKERDEVIAILFSLKADVQSSS